MANWKDRMHPDAATLLLKAARSQMELGFDELVIDMSSLSEKKQKLAAAGVSRKREYHYKSLDAHNRAIDKCLKCPLGSTRTKFVYGTGNPDAGIMFIGEAPGRDEDLQGIPFVGRAGQLLDKILAAIKFSREDVYIANILKCRPPNNRDPQPEEMKACMPYLLEQIRLINPRIICALGRIAAQGLLETTTPLGKLRKKWHDFHGIPFLVTYHPAALLRFPSYKKDVWEDVQMLRARYDELVPEKINGLQS